MGGVLPGLHCPVSRWPQRWLAICRRHQWLLDIGAGVRHKCRTRHNRNWSQLGRGGGRGRCASRDEVVVVTQLCPCSSADLRSLRILKLAF